jgi:trans-aconitate 2-methyltransferase
VLQVLTDEGERARFLAAYARRLEQAYPRQSFGTVFPFRRIFAVARRSGGTA